jgi:hypothetical protein
MSSMPERKSSTDAALIFSARSRLSSMGSSVFSASAKAYSRYSCCCFRIALAEVVELGLQPRCAVKIGRALGASFLQLSFHLGDAELTALATFARSSVTRFRHPAPPAVIRGPAPNPRRSLRYVS